MSRMKDTALDFGFVQVPVSVFSATQDDQFELKTLCHGKPPKQTIRCEEGGETYSSWVKVPQRGYPKPGSGEYIVISPEELEQAKAERPKVDSFKVEKSVDFSRVGSKYGMSATYRLLPPEKSNETSRATFRAVHETLRETGMAIMARFSPRDRVRHYVVVADEHGCLLAYEIEDLKPLPYDVPMTAADPKVKTQAKVLMESIKSDDVVLPSEPDPLFDLVQRKLAESTKLPGIGQPILIPMGTVEAQ